LKRELRILTVWLQLDAAIALGISKYLKAALHSKVIFRSFQHFAEESNVKANDKIRHKEIQFAILNQKKSQEM